jgi:hypothetical protein
MPSTSDSIRRWSFLGPILPPKGHAINDIYSNNNGKTVVAGVGPTDSIPHGPHHRRLVANVVAATRPASSIPRGTHHRCLLQLQWWPRPDPLTATHRGPTIDVSFNFGCGRCRIRRQNPLGGHNRCLLQLRWWSLPNPLAAPPRWSATYAFFSFGGGHYGIHQQHPLGGPPSMTFTTSVVVAARSTDSTP